MPNRETLLALAERCEAAERPSYELDCAIWDTIYPGERDGRFQKLTARGQPYYCRLGPADRDGYIRPLRAFTANLEAAMALVPKEWCIASLEWWPMSSAKAGVTLREVRANALGIGYDETCGDARARGQTPALALCAASLRAMAGEGGS